MYCYLKRLLGPTLVILIVNLSIHVQAGNFNEATLQSLYHSLLSASDQTQPYPVSAEEQIQYPLFSAFTQLRRADNGHFNSYSNASLIAQSRCHVLVTTAGHSLLDPVRGYPVSLSRIEVRLPSGEWIKPVEKHHPKALSPESLEYSDWALLVLRKPTCPAISSPKMSWYKLPTLDIEPVTADLFERCRNSVQMICYHPNANSDRSSATLMREAGCTIDASREQGQAAVALTSCKQSQGVSGCSVNCSMGGQILSLGIFTQGLRPAGSESAQQKVGAFRLINGELWQAIDTVLSRYDMRSGPIEKPRN